MTSIVVASTYSPSASESPSAMWDENVFENLTETNSENEHLPYCFNASSKEQAPSFHKDIVFYVEGLTLTATALIGIFGNIVTCLVLNKLGRLKSNVFNQVRPNSF